MNVVNSATELQNTTQRHFLGQQVFVRPVTLCNTGGAGTFPTLQRHLSCTLKSNTPFLHLTAINKHASLNKYTGSKMKNTNVMQSCKTFGGGGYFGMLLLLLLNPRGGQRNLRVKTNQKVLAAQQRSLVDHKQPTTVHHKHGKTHIYVGISYIQCWRRSSECEEVIW